MEFCHTTNSTHSHHHNWQNYHHDVGSSLEVFWWHCIKLDHLMYWQDGGNKRSGHIGSGGSGAIFCSVIYMYWALSGDDCAADNHNDDDDDNNCPECILVAHQLM